MALLLPIALSVYGGGNGHGQNSWQSGVLEFLDSVIPTHAGIRVNLEICLSMPGAQRIHPLKYGKVSVNAGIPV